MSEPAADRAAPDRPGRGRGAPQEGPQEGPVAGAATGLRALRGVGPAREAALARLGLGDLRDLMLLVPRGLEVWEPPLPIAEALAAGPGRPPVSIAGTVVRWSFFRRGRRRSLLRVTLEDGSGEIDALFFNQPWLRERFRKGERIELSGRVVAGKRPSFAASRLGTPDRPLPAPGSVVPLYPTGEGVSQDFLRGLCRGASEAHADELGERLDRATLERLGLPALPEAARRLHAPEDVADFVAARRRVALEPLLALQARLAGRRARHTAGSARALPIDAAAHAALLARLPHAPTEGQAAALDELRADLGRSLPMRRLLQGDVGSGKTLVGLYACLAAAAAGAQAAFMAPTEVLAAQHADGLGPLLARAGIRSAVLTAALEPERRRAVTAALAAGELDLVFGTHALFSEAVRFRELALAVIDEQHRFGVAQRERLLEKGADAHALLMTATPIPRSLALTLYGDLDLTVVRGRPPGRGAVETRWLRGERARELEALLLPRLVAGERVFWVVPRIDDAEDGAAGVETRFERLARRPLGRHGIELVHGRLPAPERAARLERFRSGEARLLVATTVIEVGVDVPEATAMVIEGAERFGLAQLHQLRGRVGRGSRPGVCLLLGDEAAAERFELLERTSDGFALAEEDLRRRGMGDLAGLRQSGDNAEGLDELTDVELLFAARDLVAADEELRAAYDDGAAPAI